MQGMGHGTPRRRRLLSGGEGSEESRRLPSLEGEARRGSQRRALYVFARSRYGLRR